MVDSIIDSPGSAGVSPAVLGNIVTEAGGRPRSQANLLIMSCIFCNDPRAAGDVLFDDDRALVILHEDWAVRGHAMVVWKAHVENFADLAADESAHFAAVHHRTERALLAATG